MGALRGPDAGESEAPTAEPGDVIGGKYRLEGLVAEGHRCQVMAATHLGLRELVAVKVPAPGAPLEEARARFAREARLCGRLRGQHLPRVHDVTADGSAVPYLVLEYLEGQTLAAWLDDCGVLPLQRAVGSALQACEALAELHSAGMVHGAVQPGKLLLTTGTDQTPSVKLLGLADATPIGEVCPEAPAVTASGTFALRFGVLAPRPAPPPRPAAPEVRAGAAVDARADVWGLGATLHELLVGAPPQLTPSAGATASPSLRARRKEIPEALETVVLQALAADPAERPVDVAALATALAPFGPPVEASAAAQRTRRLLAAPADLEGTDTTPEPPMRQSEVPTKPSMTRADLRHAAPTPVTEPALFGEHQPTLPLLPPPRVTPAAGDATMDGDATTRGDATTDGDATTRGDAKVSGPQTRDGADATPSPAAVDSLGPIAASAAPQPPEQMEAISLMARGPQTWSARRRRAAGAVTGLMVAGGALLAMALMVGGGPAPRARTAGWHALAGAEPVAALGRGAFDRAQGGVGSGSLGPVGAEVPNAVGGPRAADAASAAPSASGSAAAGKAVKPAEAKGAAARPAVAKPAAGRPSRGAAPRVTPAQAAPAKASAPRPRNDAELFTSRK